ncbi:glucan biosynthesis protein G [Azoarcus taiwanensis]|uniref:Glucans biosynthesis protein G n=1 Tax=Azoarcus taiwanensis TaxID=666964 RepID=A0A972FFR0_9RHOO|nr:glucan biosynthesis protein G [Azoarcus taiwanensis]NMG01516.1 glucan biosynthesis protein G [Azoarcus taiwanensis]
MHTVRDTFFVGAFAFACFSPVHALAFDLDTLAERARALAEQTYRAPEPIPRVMRELSYDQYQGIRFEPASSLWAGSDSRFQVMFFPAGLFYTHPVRINVIEGEEVQPLDFRKSDFSYSDPEIERRVPADLGYAGFRLTFPLAAEKEQNQFLVFAGASYFRGVGRDNAWGISGRGVAIDTGLPRGERFPSFVEFWLEQPSPDDHTVRFYGLLDGEDLTGAYEFVATPGETTRLDVKAVLFPRGEIEQLGVAPLTSMFFYGENTGRPRGEWRGEVHDSDGLLIADGASGEWLWRPLLNPVNLEMDWFAVERLAGFGLLQRDVDFSSYQDLGARYERRPGAWVVPRSEWGAGHVVLVQIPTDTETNDNIVAFWKPVEPVKAREAYRFEWTVGFGPGDPVETGLARTVNTFVGDGSVVGGGNVPGAYRFVVDFEGGSLPRQAEGGEVLSRVTGLDGTEVLEHFVEFNAALKTWRMSALVKPEAGKSVALRAFLSDGENALSETWSYRLPSDNDILVKRR